MFDRLRLFGIAALAIVVVIVILQNTAPVETKLLFVSITMPRAVLLFLTFVIGFVVGLLAAGRIARRKEKTGD